jgi:hypothetical protein
MSANVTLEIEDTKAEYRVKGNPIEKCFIEYLDECQGSQGPHL